jgi:peptidoglycan/LPS O-acetylase OafA/YrhL
MQHSTIQAPSTTVRPQALTKHIVGIDLLRVAAAMMVLAGHLTYVHWLGNPNAPATAHILEPFVWFGWVGVEIFFVISGFVIAYSVAGILKDPANAGRAHTVFFQHRLKRLFPAALVCATATAILNGVDGTQTPLRAAASWVRTLLFLPRLPLPIFRLPLVDFAYWTLTIEVVFYALIYLLLRMRWIDKLSRVMAALGAGSTLFWLVYFVTLHRVNGSIHWHYEEPIFLLGDIGMMANGCYFAMGVFLWQCLFRGWNVKRVAMIGVCLVGGVLQIVQRWNCFTPLVAVRIPATTAVVVWLTGVALIVGFTVWNARFQHLIGQTGIRVVRTLGLMTYPLYLLHQQVGLFFIDHLRLRIGDWAAIAVATTFALTCAFVISQYVEPAVAKLLWHFIRKPKATAAVPVQAVQEA